MLRCIIFSGSESVVGQKRSHRFEFICLLPPAADIAQHQIGTADDETFSRARKARQAASKKLQSLRLISRNVPRRRRRRVGHRFRGRGERRRLAGQTGEHLAVLMLYGRVAPVAFPAIDAHQGLDLGPASGVGEHRNTMVLPGNVVPIRGRDAWRTNSSPWSPHERPAFTCRATIRRDDDERTYGRHLTVVHGALVISGGLIEPKGG